MSCIMPIMDSLSPAIQDNTPKHIPIEVLIDYNNKGLKLKDIATLTGCTESNVSKRLKDSDYNPQYLKAYKDNRADLLAHYQSQLLIGLSADIKRMQPRDKVLSFGILYDKERLERGQAGQILGFEGLPDAGLSQAISGLLSKAERVGIRLTDIVGELPSQLRDSIGGLLPVSQGDLCNNGDNLPVSVSSQHD